MKGYCILKPDKKHCRGGGWWGEEVEEAAAAESRDWGRQGKK